MDTSKLIAFAEALGADNKTIMQLLATKVDTTALTQAIEQAKTAVVQKSADLGRRIDEFANVDLVSAYNTAKA